MNYLNKEYQFMITYRFVEFRIIFGKILRLTLNPFDSFIL